MIIKQERGDEMREDLDPLSSRGTYRIFAFSRRFLDLDRGGGHTYTE